MSRKEVVETIAQAIARMEGFTSGASRIARANANPGNIRKWHGRDGKPYPTEHGYVNFVAWAGGNEAKGLEEGWRILRVLIGQYIDGKYTAGPPTFYQMFEKYAPTEDRNNPRNYAQYVANALGADPGDRIIDVINRREREEEA